MFSWMQKHRRFMMFFIFVFVGLPLALMVPTGPSGGNDGSQFGANEPIAIVGKIPITSSDFLQEYSGYVDARRQQGVPTDPAELLLDGTVDDIVDNLIKQALIQQGANENPVLPEQKYLVTRLQDDPYFQNEKGEFVPSLYNQWVESQTRNGMNWVSFYENYAQGVSQSVFTSMLLASPRVSENEMHEAFVRSRRKMKVKNVKIDPEVTELVDADFLTHYESFKTNYMAPGERQVQYVAFSVQPPIPAEATTAVERARAGEVFTDLVAEYSVSADKANGGDMGWIPVTETPSPAEEVIFALKAGEVSEPFRNFSEVHIYFLEEERINEADDSMEVHGRRIVFRPTLSADELAAIEEQASTAIEQLATKDNDLVAVAEAAGLTVNTTGMFSEDSLEIEGISADDTPAFKQIFTSLNKEEVSTEIVRGNNHLFIGKVIEATEPTQLSFEDARESVENDAKNAYKNTEAYAAKVNDYVARIKAEAKSIDDIPVLFPELNVVIKETKEFGMSDFLFADGIFWESRTAFGLMGFAKPGEIMGPLVDLLRINNFLELVEMIEPDPAETEVAWAEAKETVLESRLNQIQTARQADYLQFVAEKAKNGGQVDRRDNVIYALLGLDAQGNPISDTEDVQVPDSGTDENHSAVQDEVPADVAPETEAGDTEVVVDTETVN